MMLTVARRQVFVVIFAVLVLAMASAAVAAEPTPGVLPTGSPLVVVERGTAQAEIVVAERRPRMTTLAALELQHFCER